MITPAVTAPPAVVAYTNKHWQGYTTACYMKRTTDAIQIKLAHGAVYVAYGIFDPATAGHAPSLDAVLVQTSDETDLTKIITPARGLVCLAVQKS